MWLNPLVDDSKYGKIKKIENYKNQELLFDSSSVHIFFQRTGTDNSLSLILK